MPGVVHSSPRHELTQTPRGLFSGSTFFPKLPIDTAEALPRALMATVEEYAVSVVEQYRVVPEKGSGAHRAAEEVIPLLKQWGKKYLLGITLSGAYAKNTAVTLASHADLLVALKPVPGMEMKTVFWNLFEFLTDHDLRPSTRNVSIQLQSKGVPVDVIPACRDGSGVVLFNKRTGAAVATDVGQHVHLIGNSGRQQEICAVKIWRERNGLDFPSLYLEMTVLRALENERFGQLADNVLAVLRFLASRFEQAVVRDPANRDNVLSDDLSASEKKAIAKAARNAVYEGENWKKIVW